MYTVIGTSHSRAFRVLWLLAEMGVEFDHNPAGPRSADVVAASGRGKIPVLLDGDHVITDSMAQLAYLSDKHSQFTAPAGTVARAQQDAMSFRLLDELDALLWVAARHSFILPKDQRVAGIKESLQMEYEVNINAIAEDFKGPFVLGDMLTIPDFILVACLRWGVAAKFPKPPEVLRDYLKQIKARQAFAKTAELP